MEINGSGAHKNARKCLSCTDTRTTTPDPHHPGHRGRADRIRRGHYRYRMGITRGHPSDPSSIRTVETQSEEMISTSTESLTLPWARIRRIENMKGERYSAPCQKCHREKDPGRPGDACEVETEQRGRQCGTQAYHVVAYSKIGGVRRQLEGSVGGRPEADAPDALLQNLYCTSLKTRAERTHKGLDDNRASRP